MMPAATSGMTCGRNSTVRVTLPRRPVATRWMTDAVTEPERHRDDAEEHDQLERVDDRAQQVGVAQHGEVVVDRPTQVAAPTPFQR